MSDDDEIPLRVRDTELLLWSTIDVPAPPARDDRIHLFKDRRFLLALTAVLDRIAPQRMIEIGIFQGGSLIYWAERYPQAKLSAFDLEPDAVALQHYLERHALTDRVRTHFGVSQDDRAALRHAVAADLGDLVDVVIDDASHLYEATRASLEALLPLVRPGGAYIIEDWAWPPMAPLLAQLPALLWEPRGALDRIEIDMNCAVLWRGQGSVPTDGTFSWPAS